MRVVSLLPSATEIVCALGSERQLVGVSHECDFPESVRRLPVLTSARIDATGSSKAIDTAVRAVIHDALSIYSVNERRLAELSPDVIVTQDLCEMCAVSLDDVRAAVARLAPREAVRIISLRPTRLGPGSELRLRRSGVQHRRRFRDHPRRRAGGWPLDQHAVPSDERRELRARQGP